MNHIHWYPGHIAKAERELKEKLNLVDVILEITDARIPYSSRYKNISNLCKNKPRLILMNKADVSDKNYNKIWAKITEAQTNCKVIITSLSNKQDINFIFNNIISLTQDITKKRTEKGLLPRPVRTMVVGMPNTGKSSTINKLVKKAKTKTGAKAGVTRMQQWVRINEKIELLDTPGVIPTVQDDQNQALNLAFVNSIGENAYDSEFVARKLLDKLLKYYPDEVKNYYDINTDMTLENIAIEKKWILKKVEPDIIRTSQYLLTAFREGKIGKFTIERPEEYGLV